MKSMLFRAAALLLLLGAASPQRFDIAGTPLSLANRDALEASLRRALPSNVDVRVVVIDREVGTR
jgi:hypothetical protein